jgi:hypothetical protein
MISNGVYHCWQNINDKVCHLDDNLRLPVIVRSLGFYENSRDIVKVGFGN